jgi:hypothetical protein
MNREKQTSVAHAIAWSNADGVKRAINDALIGETGKNNIRDFGKLASFIDSGIPEFSVIARQGNVKLPFASFSSLPGASFCPGAGDCLSWCYSFRAWRYPAAFARQCQNQYLLQSESGRAHILRALDACKPTDGTRLDFRLYVDGDFSRMEILEFWMDAIRARPWLRAYGYSKSFALFLAYDGEWPSNYLVNLSGGHKYSDAVVDRMRKLPVVRGRFEAVSIGRKVRTSDHGTRETNSALRRAYGGRPFTCPGKCGECTPRGHACGSDRFRDIDIVIAVH